MIPQSNQGVERAGETIDPVSTMAARLPGERRYYLIAAVGIIVVVLAGFSIDFGLLFDMSSLSFLVRAHGLVMFGWVGVFFMQVFLVARHRVDLHRRLRRDAGACGCDHRNLHRDPTSTFAWS